MFVFKIKSLFICLFIVGLFQPIAKGQAIIPKKAGICFRFDDYQDSSKIASVLQLFDKYNGKFTYAANAGIAEIVSNQQFWSFLRTMQTNGHEVADQTPSDVSHFFEAINATESKKYLGLPGVDHIRDGSRRICLKYTVLDNSGTGDEGLVDIKGDLMISKQPGEFSNLRLFNNKFVVAFYLPGSGELIGFSGFSNLNSNDPDTAFLRDFWFEPINLGNRSNINYNKLSPYQLTVDKQGLQLMLEYSSKLFAKHGVQIPTTLVHPGGYHPYVSSSIIKEVSQSMGFTGAASYPAKRNFLTYYNPAGLRQFNFQGVDFTPETQTATEIKKIIANFYALNQVGVCINHMSFGGPINSFSQMLANMEEVLVWAKSKQIPVLTYKDWTNQLAYGHYNPTEDIFPALQNDLDGDEEIDGIDLTNPNFLDKNAGLAYNANYALTTNSVSTLFYIQNLGGITKGLNTFTVSTRGGKDAYDYFRLLVYYPELGTTQFFDIPTNSIGFLERKVSFYVPEGVTYLNLTLNYNTDKATRAYASGFKLNAELKPVIKPSTFEINTNEIAKPISLDSFASCVGYTFNQLKWSVLKSPFLFDASFENGNNLKLVPKFQKFPITFDSIQLRVTAPNSKTDTAWFYIRTKHAQICNGQITAINFSRIPSIEKSYSWSAQNQDPLFSNTQDSFIWVRPSNNNLYTLQVQPISGNQVSHSIPVSVIPTRIAGYPNETKQFLGAQTVAFNLNYNPEYRVYFYELPQAEAKVTIQGKKVIVGRDVNFSGNLEVKLLVVSPTCEAYLHSLNVNTWALGNNKLLQQEVKVYPNPAQTIISVNGLSNFEAAIYDLQGKCIKSFGLNQTLDVSAVENGIYVLKLSNEISEYVQKIIIAH